jgi:PAS domain S-box-containing protein
MGKNKRPTNFDERIGYLRKHEKMTDLDDFDVKELIQELQIFKIELEMQNEELRDARNEVEESRNKYLSLFETAPVGFFSLDSNGVILEVNEKGVALLGQRPGKLKGRRFQEFIQSDYLPVFYDFFMGLQKAVEKKISEVQLEGTLKYVQMEGILANEKNKDHTTVQLAIIDVTLRKKEEERYAQQKLAQQKEILNTILETQEEERVRIAEALHNGLGQLLYATKLKVEDIRDNKEVKDQIRDFLDEAIAETRNLSFLMMPSLLKDFGLKVILEETARRFSTKTLKLECNVIGMKERLPGIIETAVFRVVQELLNNILKHSGATLASILIRKNKGKLRITVKDNGRGFDYQKVLDEGKGTGLNSVFNRIHLLNGDLQIRSRRGKGTTVIVTL